MDLSFEESVLNLELLKAQDILQSESDICCLSMMEAVRVNDEFVMEKSFKEFMNKAAEVFQKILAALQKFFKDMRVQIQIKCQQIQLNKKLDELKNLMAKKRSQTVNKRVDYFDIKKYKAYYTDFINRYTSELIKGMSREFNSVEEYEKWRVSMLNKLSDFNYTLSDEEQWKLSVTINSAVQLSTEEANNREKNLKMVEESGSSSIKNLERYYKKIDTENSFVNYNGTKLKIFSLQNSFIGMVCTKISDCIKKVAKFIMKHTFGCIIALIAALIAIG